MKNPLGCLSGGVPCMYQINSNHDYVEGSPTIHKSWFMNPRLTLPSGELINLLTMKIIIFFVGTNLPTLMTARVYVNLTEGTLR